jgi:hypothetical protein
VTVLVVAGATATAGLLALRPDSTHVSVVPAAGEPTTVSAVSPAPTCSAALAALPPGALTPPSTPPSSTSAADSAKQAASDAADAANHAATGLRGVKGVGTIVSANDTSVTIAVAVADPSEPAEITATFAPDVIYVDGGTAVDVRPPLAAGDRVFFGATQADDRSYKVIYLQVHPAEAELQPDAMVDPAVKAANAGDESRYVKALAEVVSMQPDSLSVKPTDGPLAGQVVTAATGPDTVYAVGGQTCVAPELTAGITVGVLLIRGNDATYSARQVALFPA